MRTSELLKILETAEQLGHKDLPIVLANGRDGVENFQTLNAEFHVISGPNNSEERVLLMVEKY